MTKFKTSLRQIPRVQQSLSQHKNRLERNDHMYWIIIIVTIIIVFVNLTPGINEVLLVIKLYFCVISQVPKDN